MATHPVVKHKQLGRCKLVRILQDGALLEVVTELSGRRYTLPSADFEPIPTALPPSSFEARRTIETLRAGIVPSAHAEDLTVGLSDERARLQDALTRTQKYGGAALAVLANYGCGKTHFLALAERLALRQNFLVATLSADARELQLSQTKRIYQQILEKLRYPDTPERGLAPLLWRAYQQPELAWSALNDAAKDGECPFVFAVSTYLDSQTDSERLGALRYLLQLPNTLKRAPRIFSNGNVARQYVYLLSAVSALASALGYSGLALLIDEVDYYSRLMPIQCERAKNFFKALICASQGKESTALDADAIPDHDKVRYPLRFSDRSALFFMFATTEDEQQIPVSAWLSPALLIYLDNRFNQHEIAQFLQMVGAYHAQAFQYPPIALNDGLLRLARILARALRERRSETNARWLAQTAVIFYDLLYHYPERSADQRIQELANALNQSEAL